MWLQAFEAYLTARLLQSRTFHKFVYNLTHRIHNNGQPPPAGHHYDDGSELGGVNREGEKPGIKEFLRIYKEEFTDELKGRKK